MRIIFMGSAPLACPSLESLLPDNANEIVAAVTQPDRPKGRGRKISSSAIKDLALNAGITVLKPEKVNMPDSIASIKALRPDLITVVAYGQILKPELLAIPPQGCINLHASLLPKYRGAAPIQWALANGEKRTGVTVMFMNEGMDEGDLIMQKDVNIDVVDTAGSLHDKLAKNGAAVLTEVVEKIRTGQVPRTPQVDAEATYAPKLSKDDGRINWTLPAEAIYNKVRAFNPWPVCWSSLPTGMNERSKRPQGSNSQEKEKAQARLRILAVRIENSEGAAGEVMDMSGDGPLIAAGDRSVRLLEVQSEGHKIMSAAAYVRGHALQVGDVLP